MYYENVIVIDLIHRVVVYRCRKGKVILLASLSCWIIFTLPLGFIQPPATSCMIYKNHSRYLYIPDSDQKIVKRSANLEKEKIALTNIADLKDSSHPMSSKHPDSSQTFDVQIPQEYRYIDRELGYNIRRKRREIGDVLKTYNRTENVDNGRMNLEEFSKHNRPADMLQYKKFLKVRRYNSLYNCKKKHSKIIKLEDILNL